MLGCFAFWNCFGKGGLALSGVWAGGDLRVLSVGWFVGLWCVRVLNCVGLVDGNTFFACWAATRKPGFVVRTLV